MTELRSIKEELDYIKIHMVDKDMFLDAEEKQLLEESHENEKQGRLTSQDEKIIVVKMDRREQAYN